MGRGIAADLNVGLAAINQGQSGMDTAFRGGRQRVRQHWSPTLEAAAKQVGAALTGAQKAVKAYKDGQEEMTLTAQHAAANGVIPDPPGGAKKQPTGKNKAE